MSSVLFLLGYLRKIDHWSILGNGMSAYSDFLLDPAWFSLQNRSLVDFQERTKQNQAESRRIVMVSRCGSLWRGGGRKPAGIGFYLHKEFRAARIRCYRGTMQQKTAIFKGENSFCRGSKIFKDRSDFIYTKNFARPGSDFIGGRCGRKSQFSKRKTAFAGVQKFFDGKLVAHRQFLVGTLVVLIF